MRNSRYLNFLKVLVFFFSCCVFWFLFVPIRFKSYALLPCVKCCNASSGCACPTNNCSGVGIYWIYNEPGDSFCYRPCLGDYPCVHTPSGPCPCERPSWCNGNPTPPPPPPSDPPPGGGCVAQGGTCVANSDCCSGLRCEGGRCLGGVDCTCASGADPCNPQYTCGHGGGNENCSGNCWMDNIPHNPNDPWCHGDTFIHACRLSAGDYCHCCNCCSYSGIPSCGLLQVRRSGTDTSSSCVSGLVDIVATDVKDAERVFVQAVSGSGNEKNYWLSKIDNRTWRITGVDLGSDVGFGLVNLRLFPNNCKGRNNDCPFISIYVFPKPDCPPSSHLNVSPICGATKSVATFSWWENGYDNNPPYYVLRVNREDGTAIPGDWMSDNDFWVWVNKEADDTPPPCGYFYNWLGDGYWLCTLDETTPPHSGVGGFKAGYYRDWWVQAVDGCGVYENQCETHAPAFTCSNTLPTCTIPNIPDIVFAGQNVSISSGISDTIDPMEIKWGISCTFPPGTPPPSYIPPPIPPLAGGNTNLPPSTVTVSWNPGSVPAGLIPLPCTLTISVTDGSVDANGNKIYTSCSKGFTLTNPTLSGKIMSSQCDPSEGIEYSPTIDIYRGSESVKTFSLDGNKIYSTTDFTYHTGSLTYNIGLHPGSYEVPDDTTLEPVCVDNTNFTLNPGIKGVSGTMALTTNTVVNIGYGLHSTLDTGWFTSIFGPWYSKDSVSWIFPSSDTSVYGSFFSPATNMNSTNRFAFSTGDLDITSAEDSNSVSSFGYAKNVGTPGFSFSFKEPSDSIVESFTAIGSVAGFSGLNPNTIYRMDVGLANDIIDSGNYSNNYSSRITQNGTVVIYITDANETGDPLLFTKNFLTQDSKKKFLFITPGDVKFSPAVGKYTLAGNTTDVSIFATVIAGGDIIFPTLTESGSEISDSSLAIRGSLISGGNVDFSRDLKLRNYDPSVVVFFEPSYYTDLQRQILASESFERSFFGMVSVSWKLDN